ncbi:MAG: Zn-dependent alcohol dehydrogenase [Parvibaculaceae bacterium]
MKAAVMHEVGKPLTIEDVQVSKPGEREVLIRTAAAGVCHSDVHFWNGTYPFPLPAVLGHESAGVVEAVGSMVSHVSPGDHVITILSPFCGTCEYCLTGHMSVCATQNPKATTRTREEQPRLSLRGQPITQYLNLSSFAETMLVHENAVAKIRKDMPLDRAALIGCGVITGVGAVFHTARVEPGSTVAVIGCGGVGLSCINGAALAGASRIIGIDLQQSKLDLAKKFGATDIVDASKEDPVAVVRELTGGGVHYSFEAIGLKTTAEQAFEMLRATGVATVIGMLSPEVKLEISGLDLLGQEKHLQGSIMGSNRFRVDFPRLVEFYMQGRLKLDELISSRIKLTGVTDALRNLEENRGEVARQVILFD